MIQSLRDVAEKEHPLKIAEKGSLRVMIVAEKGLWKCDCREGVHSPGKRIAEEKSGVFGGLRKKGLEKFFRCISI